MSRKYMYRYRLLFIVCVNFGPLQTFCGRSNPGLDLALVLGLKERHGPESDA